MSSSTMDSTDLQKRAPERDQDCDPDQAQERQQPRKRARLSCDACAARKTKCVGFESGACQYCTSLGLPCEVDLKGRKRLVYRVSGETYEYSIKLLRHFVPEEELPDLTAPNIQAHLRKLENRPRALPDSSAPAALSLPVENGVGLVTPAPSLPAENGVAVAPTDQSGINEVMELDEHPQIQEASGCMVLDSMGKYRYVGADSSIRWNHAVRMAKETPSGTDPKIILPVREGSLPPTTRGTPVGSRRERMYLPPRQVCMSYVARFFDHIHCVYWFYSSEQFYTRLDHTLGTLGTGASPSWLCALYSIFALGSMRPGDCDIARPRNAPQDVKTSPEYLSMARDLSTDAADEADLDSVKAFALLSLATHARCYSVTAYLHLGTAVKIGFSLGLHRDVSLGSKDSLERERDRRLWWTIYVLDYEMSSRFGYPCSVAESAVFMRTPPATEQMLDPGPNTPLGYQALLASIIQLRKKINHECFLEPDQVGGRLPISRVTGCLASLRQWLDDVPTRLRWDSSLHPQHRRTVSLLHLRYWGSVISLTRPFLLFTATRSADTMIPVKRKIYEQMSNSCIEATESAVQIIRRMREDNTLSSLMLLDCHCIGEVMWILILALQKLGGKERQGMLRFCLETVTSMEKIGWCEKVSPELEARVHESGVLEAAPMQPAQPTQPLWGQVDRSANQVVEENAMPFGVSASRASAGDLDYDALSLNDSQFDVFETLDIDTRTGILDMFMDASFSGSQFLCDNLDSVYQLE